MVLAEEENPPALFPHLSIITSPLDATSNLDISLTLKNFNRAGHLLRED